MNGKTVVFLLILVVLAGVVKIAYLVEYEETDPLADFPYGDSLVYLDEGKRHFETDQLAAFYKPPLYSFLLSLLKADSPAGRRAVRVIQLLCGVAILVCVFLLAQARAGPWAGLLSSMICLCYAPMTFFETKLLDTVLGLFFLTLAFTLFDRLLCRSGKLFPALLVGLLFGLASITRSSGLICSVILLCYIPFQCGWKHFVACAAGLAIWVLPVMVHNFRACGEIIPINYSDGHTFLVGNNENAMGIYNLPPGYSDGVLNEGRAEYEYARKRLNKEPSPGEQRALSYRDGLSHLKAHPERIPELLLFKVRFTVSNYEVPDNYSLLREQDREGLLPCLKMPFVVILMLGLLGLLLKIEGKRITLWIPLATYTLLLLIFYVSCRYRLPLVPFLCVSGGAGLWSLIRGLKPRPGKAALVAMAVIVVLVPLMGLPYDKANLVDAEEAFNLMLDLHVVRKVVEKQAWEEAADLMFRTCQLQENERKQRGFLRYALRSMAAEDRDRLESWVKEKKHPLNDLLNP